MNFKLASLFFGSIFICNLFAFTTILPLFNVVSTPSAAGAVAGSFALMIPYGAVIEALGLLKLGSLFEGSDLEQVVRGASTQLLSVSIGLCCLRLLENLRAFNAEWQMIGAVLVVCLFAIALASSIVRICEDKRKKSSDHPC
jgi:Na+/citrate or Na+/malate symporter